MPRPPTVTDGPFSDLVVVEPSSGFLGGDSDGKAPHCYTTLIVFRGASRQRRVSVCPMADLGVLSL